MMMTSKLLIASMSILAFSVHATSYEKVITTGQGETLDEAIDVGLRRAVEQVSGVSVDSKRLSSLTSKNDGNTSTLMQQSANATAMRSRGDVKYKVLTERCDNNACSVRLEVQVEVDPRSKIKDLNTNRRTISIGSFSGPKSSTISKKVQEFLVQDRKFKVLNDSSDPTLQYVVTGRVLEAKTTKRVVDKSRTVELTGEYIKDVNTYYDSRVVVEFKILDVVNNQVKWSATIPTTSSRNNLSLLLDIASKKVFTQLKDNIYPLMVLVGDNGSLILNSGGSTVKVGQYLDVFNLGEKFIDPVTKESLGRDEIQVATVKVSKVLPKMAYLTVVKGDASAVKNHSIARQSIYSPALPKSSVKSSKTATKIEEKTSGIIL
ncbi:hypothetical protein VSVS12_02699 [Vibrio scophthalmi]|uniref:hypothetical protein n=1 Tax=Vibrio scophthalmi TaxID=45658 RepID=UPI0008099B85|nr:hypothetical protein [Vibrio scophthalmi]ANS86448.1 hypothetical protein VSVS12_02699 [Vibrio scophthalmi]